MYGDLNDPDSVVSKAIREAGEENVYSLPDCGNQPMGKYILRNAKWLDVLPQEFEKELQGGKTHE